MLRCVMQRCASCNTEIHADEPYPCPWCGWKPLGFPWVRWALAVIPFVVLFVALRALEVY